MNNNQGFNNNMGYNNQGFNSQGFNNMGYNNQGLNNGMGGFGGYQNPQPPIPFNNINVNQAIVNSQKYVGESKKLWTNSRPSTLKQSKKYSTYRPLNSVLTQNPYILEMKTH